MEEGQSVLKILVCDDDQADRKLVRAYLQQINDREIVLLEAGKRDEIHNALDRGRIDLVFMDIRMPEKSGMEWLEDIVKKRMAPVVMLTGFGSEEIAVQALQQGAISYLSKSGLSKGKLVETIDDAIEKMVRFVDVKEPIKENTKIYKKLIRIFMPTVLEVNSNRRVTKNL